MIEKRLTVSPGSSIEKLTVHPLLRKGPLYSLLALCGLLLLVALVATALGSAAIPLPTVVQILLSRIPGLGIEQTWDASLETIVLNIRLPRLLLAGLVGANLAVAGATYQGIFRNPLADPYLIGVASGAALGATLGIAVPIPGGGIQPGMVPFMAFAGAMLAVAIVYGLARVGNTMPVTTLLLAGVALGSFLSSITSYIMIVNGDKLYHILSWLLGGFALSGWSQVFVILPYSVLGLVIILACARPLNIMQLDEEQAQQLGIDVERMKIILLVAASLITAAAVSVSGIIGFVGIIVPHAARLIWGPDHRYLIPFSTLLGGIFLIAADTVARTVLSPAEIPVGIITAFFGAPFFLYLLRQKKKAVF